MNCLQVTEVPSCVTMVPGTRDGNALLPAIHAFASGEVQRVGFRYFVENAAIDSGVYGFVRNLKDGRVEMHAEGEAKQIVDFLNKICGFWTHPRLEVAETNPLSLKEFKTLLTPPQESR